MCDLAQTRLEVDSKISEETAAKLLIVLFSLIAKWLPVCGIFITIYPDTKEKTSTLIKLGYITNQYSVNIKRTTRTIE